MPLLPSGHSDTFARDNLPPYELWPPIASDLFVAYPEQLNVATELLSSTIDRGWGSRRAIHHGERWWTYRELASLADGIAHVLKNRCGLLPGNRVLLRGPNTPLLAASWFGVLKAGGICVTTMPLLRAGELSYIIEKAKVQFALCDDAWREELDKATDSRTTPLPLVSFNCDHPDSLESLASRYSTPFHDVATSRDDVAIIAFTSGSTGRAKATMHFHRDLLAICDLFPTSVMKTRETDVFCGTPPLAFTFGLGGLLLFPFRVGGSSVFLSKTSPDALLEAVQQHRITAVFTSPTAYRAMTELVSRFDLSSLRLCVSAGETLPRTVYDDWKRTTDIDLIDGIGATEMLHIFISSAGRDIRPGATGKVIPGYEACILDEEGNRLPAGTVGLLAVRGPTGCRYLDDIERQREYVKFGWNVTGDAYLQDAEGYFYFHSRADDMIIASGYNISGVEVENAILLHPMVKECVVIGAPSADRGTVVKACIVPRLGVEATDSLAKDIQEFVKSTIAPYKYPRVVEFVAELPRTETGKVQRFRLRECSIGK